MCEEELVFVLNIPNSKGIPYACKPSDKGFGGVIEVPAYEVSDIEQYSKGLLNGIMMAKGVNLERIVFQPADTLDAIGTAGKPLYVYKEIVRGIEYYQFHIFFDTQISTLCSFKFEDIVVN